MTITWFLYISVNTYQIDQSINQSIYIYIYSITVTVNNEILYNNIQNKCSFTIFRMFIHKSQFLSFTTPKWMSAWLKLVWIDSSWTESGPVEFPPKQMSGWKLHKSVCTLDLEPGSIWDNRLFHQGKKLLNLGDGAKSWWDPKKCTFRTSLYLHVRTLH